MATITSRVVGVLYVVFGLAGFALGDEADRYHNLLHLATGVVGVYVGSTSGARGFCLTFGAGYLAFGVLGFTIGNPSMEYLLDIGLFSVSMPDHVHHLLLGTVILAGGMLARAGIRRRRPSPLRSGVASLRSGR